MQEDKVFYVHLHQHNHDKQINPYGGVTIGYSIHRNVVHYALAKCKSVDRFNRKVGRAITTGRLRKGKHDTLIDNNLPSQTSPHSYIIPKLIEKYYEEARPHWSDVSYYVY